MPAASPPLKVVLLRGFLVLLLLFWGAAIVGNGGDFFQPLLPHRSGQLAFGAVVGVIPFVLLVPAVRLGVVTLRGQVMAWVTGTFFALAIALIGSGINQCSGGRYSENCYTEYHSIAAKAPAIREGIAWTGIPLLVVTVALGIALLVKRAKAKPTA